MGQVLYLALHTLLSYLTLRLTVSRHYYNHFTDNKTKAILQGLLVQGLHIQKVCECLSGQREPPQMAMRKAARMCLCAHFWGKGSELSLVIKRCIAQT